MSHRYFDEVRVSGNEEASLDTQHMFAKPSRRDVRGQHQFITDELSDVFGVWINVRIGDTVGQFGVAYIAIVLARVGRS